MRLSLVKSEAKVAPVIRDIHKHSRLQESLIEDSGKEVFDFLQQHVDLDDEHCGVFKTNSIFNFNSLSDNYFKAIINLCKINDIQRINKFFEAVNRKLPYQGTLIGCVETKGQRKKRILNKYPRGLAEIYYTGDFILKRIFPKLPLTKSIYFKITAGRNRVISRTETLGRLYACGFRVMDAKLISGTLYFVAAKIKEPTYDSEPSYGPIYKMKRIGKDGKMIQVYKVRTMHPFSEYLQEYIYEQNALREGGKFNNDFRISTLGRFLRKYWLDELPMILNLLKGDLKIVGVRPLSSHYLSLYDDDLKSKRLKFKPGLIPPYYADLPKTLEEIMESENRYLNAYAHSPFFTDIKYFFKALKNILFKRARSN